MSSINSPEVTDIESNTESMAATDKVLVYEYRAGRKDQPQIMTVEEVEDKVRKSTY